MENAMIINRSGAALANRNDIESWIPRFMAFIDRGEATTRSYLTNLRQFAAYLRYAGISTPTRPDIINYRDWLMSEHDAVELAPYAPEGWQYRLDRSGARQRVQCKPATVKLYLQSVKQFYAWAALEGLTANITINIHPPKVVNNHKKDALAPRDVVAVEDSISQTAAARRAAASSARKDCNGRVQRSTEQGLRLYAMYMLAVNAGLRTIEISRAKIRDLEIKHGQAYLYVWGKGHEEADAIKPLAAPVYDAIRDYLDARKDTLAAGAPLFASTGNRSGGKAIAATTISKMLKSALITAGYDSDRLTAHSLRHTAGQGVMDVTGDNIYQTQLYMRHNDPKTTEIYLDNKKTDLDAEIANKLYAHYHHDASAEQSETDEARQQLQAMMGMLSAQSLEMLAAIASQMTKQI